MKIYLSNALTNQYSFIDRDMMMRYTSLAPGHLVTQEMLGKGDIAFSYEALPNDDSDDVEVQDQNSGEAEADGEDEDEDGDGDGEASEPEAAYAESDTEGSGSEIDETDLGYNSH